MDRWKAPDVTSCEIVLQHAPYDAMVLVSMCWYLDQQIRATEGQWKVNANFHPILDVTFELTSLL